MNNKNDIHGSRKLSAKAKDMWKYITSKEQLPNSRQVMFNVVHNYCFFVCQQPSCDGCNVVKLRSWLSNVKELPQDMGVPVVRNLNTKALGKAEAKIKPVIMERSEDA